MAIPLGDAGDLGARPVLLAARGQPVPALSNVVDGLAAAASVPSTRIAACSTCRMLWRPSRPGDDPGSGRPDLPDAAPAGRSDRTQADGPTAKHLTGSTRRSSSASSARSSRTTTS